MSDMADVLRSHWSASTHSDRKPFVDKCDGCGVVIFTWGDPAVGNGSDCLSDHQAAMLSAAGFGPVQQARSEAIHEAAAVGWDAAVAAMKYEDGTPVDLAANINPYRT